MRRLIARFLAEEDGMEMVEWALVAGLITLAAVTAWENLGVEVSTALAGVDVETGAVRSAPR